CISSCATRFRCHARSAELTSSRTAPSAPLVERLVPTSAGRATVPWNRAGRIARVAARTCGTGSNSFRTATVKESIGNSNLKETIYETATESYARWERPAESNQRTEVRADRGP